MKTAFRFLIFAIDLYLEYKRRIDSYNFSSMMDTRSNVDNAVNEDSNGDDNINDTDNGGGLSLTSHNRLLHDVADDDNDEIFCLNVHSRYRHASVRFIDLLLNILPFSGFCNNFFRDIESIEMLSRLARDGFSFRGLRGDDSARLRCAFCAVSPMSMTDLLNNFLLYQRDTGHSDRLEPRERTATNRLSSLIRLLLFEPRRRPAIFRPNFDAIQHRDDCRSCYLNVDDLTLSVKLDGLYYVYHLIEKISSFGSTRNRVVVSSNNDDTSNRFNNLSTTTTASSMAFISGSITSSSFVVCKICYSEKCVVLVPCGHVYVCRSCWLAIDSTRCPVCRSHVSFEQSLYF